MRSSLVRMDDDDDCGGMVGMSTDDPMALI